MLVVQYAIPGLNKQDCKRNALAKAAPHRACQRALHDQLVKRLDQGDVSAAHLVMAMHDARHRDTAILPFLPLAQQGQSKIEVAVIFTHNDFIVTDGINTEDADTPGRMSRQLLGSLDTERLDDSVAHGHQGLRPGRLATQYMARQAVHRHLARLLMRQIDGIRVGQIATRIQVDDAALWRHGHGAYGYLHRLHKSPMFSVIT